MEIKENKNKFYCNGDSKKINLKYFKLIKKHMPDLNFKYNEESDYIYSSSDIRNEDNNVAFQIQTGIRKNELLVTFCFDTDLNNKTTWYVNVFNATTAPTFKAYIDIRSDHSHFLQIDHFTRIKNVDEAYEEFETALNYINRARFIKWIKPIYEIYNPDTISIKEMN